MPDNKEPEKGDRLEKPYQPDIKKGRYLDSAPIKPILPQKPVEPPKQNKNQDSE